MSRVFILARRIFLQGQFIVYLSFQRKVLNIIATVEYSEFLLAMTVLPLFLLSSSVLSVENVPLSELSSLI